MVRRPLNWPLVILQGLVRMLRLSTGRRFKVFVLSGLFGLSFLTTSLGALPIVASHVQAQSLVVSQGNPRQDLQQGILLYKAERYAEAIALWNAALATFAQQNDSIGQALSLNNLSLGYQQLGQWPEAETAVSQSLEILSEAQTSLPSADVHETLGKVLNTQGELLWAQGKPEAALAIWEDAVGYYQMAAHSVGVAIAQINQAKALQSLGLNAQATTLLSEVYQTLRQTADDDLQAAGLKALGQALRRIGELAQAQDVLLEGSRLAQEPAAKGEILLELGNTEQDLRRQALARGQMNVAETLAANGLNHYRLAAQLASSPLLSSQAQVNALRLLILTGQWDAVASAWPSMVATLLDLSPSRSAVYAQLNFADSLTCLRQPSQLAVLTCMGNVSSQQPIVTDAPLELAPPPSETIARILTTAIGYSRQIQDTLSESFALGQLGQLYAVNRQPTEAIALTKQGIERAESLQVSESAFRLYRQLGQLLNQTDNRQAAIAAYKEAVDALDQIRGSLLRINSEVLFSFRDNTEPIYREFVDLLLTGNPSDTSLREAVRNIDNLQRTELENFLGCDLSQLFEIGTGTIDPTAAKIYPIILPERLAIILEIPGQSLRYYQTPVSQGQFEKALRDLRTQLTEPGLTPEVIVEATKIYQWLIDPLEPALENNPQIQTLIFVPDGALRNIPMGVLYDEDSYFIEKGYAIAVAPQLDLFSPRKSPQNLSVLAGGVEIPQTIEGVAFPPITGVKAELSEIPSQFLASPPLLNDDFTIENIQERLNSGEVSAVHWKTHGIFSSDPTGTYLVTYRNTINASVLSQLVQSSRQRRGEPLEFMALSACETAQGDNRAVLGLAGLAVRAGARSTLSTLWRAEDDANTRLMADFYRFLQQGESKAKALQKAQVKLLQEGYAAPYYWATYILVGNWL